MTVVVADASAILEYLLRTERSAPIEDIVRQEEIELHVPALCDVEVAAGLRRALARNLVTEERAGEALGDYLDLPLTRHGHQSLMGRILTLRRNFSVYDATYVALAEQLGATFLTADLALARATTAQTGVAILPQTGTS